MEAPTPIGITREIKNEYIFKINKDEYKLSVFKENQNMIFSINQLNKLSLYYYENRYELLQLIDLLNLNSNLYGNFQKISEFIHEAYLNKKITLNYLSNKISIKIKFTIGFKEHECSIDLNEKEYNINNRFEKVFSELFFLKSSKNEYLNDKLNEIEKLILNIKDLINKKLKENEKIINELKTKITKNKEFLMKNEKDFYHFKKEIFNFKIQAKLPSICKIVTKNGKEACGFLMKSYKGDKPFFCLILSNSIINKNMIKSKDIIDIFYDKLNKKFNIDLNKQERFILDFSFINIDAIVIEIIPKDNIHETFFLPSNLIYRGDLHKIKNKNIYIVNFQQNNDIYFIDNQITSINQYEYIYSKNLSGIPGSPIFLEGATYIVGINKEKRMGANIFSGNTLMPIVDSLQLNSEYEKLRNGKDLYEGFVKNKKYEGYGKYIYENGNYYIGQFSNSLKHGNGVEYYKNNTVKFDGIYSKDKCNLFGKYIYENGNYYIGQFLNGLKHGSGIEYYKNNNPKYEGEFVNDKCEGYGKYIYENGNYYIGRFLNGLKHGKGILYYKNNIIKYEGNFVNDKCEGYGKFIYDSGEYYIGQFSNNKRNGKGTLYHKNGTVKYEGKFVNGEIVE